MIEPSSVAVNYDPMKLWSKSGAMDPDNGVFHPYLENRGIDNWQFDMFLRFLKNQEGGMINIYLDNKLIN